MAELCSQVLGLFKWPLLPFPLFLSYGNRIHKAKFNLIRRIICLINLIFNIQTEAFPLSIFIKDVHGGMLMSHDIINRPKELEAEKRERGERKTGHFRKQKGMEFSSWIRAGGGGCLGRNTISEFRAVSCVRCCPKPGRAGGAERWLSQACFAFECVLRVQDAI